MQRSDSIKWIASLRGLLVLLVFISHSRIMDKDVSLAVGKAGVAGFFLISGYLVVNSIEKRSVKQFLFNRFIRLYPVYWILVFLELFALFLTRHPVYNYKEMLANLTFFQQYFGFDSIIGLSWMMSIMVVFFLLVAVVRGGGMNVLFFVMAVSALFSGYLRFSMDKPFPTALCLMCCMGFLGAFYKKRGLCRNFVIYTVFFEIVLFISGYLSYGDKLGFYEIAYNGAFLLFFMFEYVNVHNISLSKIGSLGFTFFLGADVPIILLFSFFPVLKELFVVRLIVHFASCILFSYVITKFIETPVIQWGKKIELKLKGTS